MPNLVTINPSVPAATPRGVIDRVNAATRKTMVDPVVKPRLLEFIIEPTPMTPEQFGDYIQTETVKWGKLVRESGVTIE